MNKKEDWNLELSEYIKPSRKNQNMGNSNWFARCRWIKAFKILDKDS